VEVTPPGAFVWYELRTTHPDAAAAFYRELLGWQVQEVAPGARVFVRDGQPVAGLGELPETARARGASAHWLGHVRVADLDAALERWRAEGGQPLGPERRFADGRVAGVRDAEGAGLALSTRAVQAAPGAIVWHQLLTTERERAFVRYAGLFGWHATLRLEVGPPFGTYQTFAWREGGVRVGGVVESARAPHIHCQWLYHFGVPDLDAALATVRAAGGLVAEAPRELGATRVAVCDDPQGAAFALAQPL
jgi:predicted enzyme related to lactoylglutathione lyase